MKPRTNRAARCKPCKKQASREHIPTLDSSKIKTSIKTDEHSYTSISSTNESASLSHHPQLPHSSQVPPNIINPYKNKPNPKVIPSQIQDALDNDNPKETYHRKETQLSSSPQISDDDSSFVTEVSQIISRKHITRRTNRRSPKSWSSQQSIVNRLTCAPQASSIVENSVNDPSIRPQASNYSPLQSPSHQNPIEFQLSPADTKQNVNATKRTSAQLAPQLNTQNIRDLLRTLSQSSICENDQESRSLVREIMDHCISFDKHKKVFEANERKLKEQSKLIRSQFQEITNSPLLSTPNEPFVPYQFTPDNSTSTSSHTSSSVSFRPRKSKYSKLNPYASEGDDTFFTSTETSISDASPQYCDIEEISDQKSSASVSSSLPSPSHKIRNQSHHTLPTEPWDPQIASSSPKTKSALKIEENKVESIFTRDENPIVVNLSPHTVITQQNNHDSHAVKNENNIRIVSQNCRGVFPKEVPRNEHYIPSIESFMDIQADAVLLTETNVDWKVQDQHWEISLLNKHIQKPSPTKTITSSCVHDNPRSQTHQTGGVMSLFTNTLPSRIQQSSSDRYGRWTRTSIQLKQRKLVIYNTYRTHKKTLQSVGIDTPWMHQWVALRKDFQDGSVNPRRKHMEDLLLLVEKDASEGNVSLIFGDFNEDLKDKEEGGLEVFEQSPYLVNAYSHFHGTIPSSRLNNRQICHLYMSPSILRYVTRLGTCSIHDGFVSSDHIPLFVDFDEHLLREKTDAIIFQHSRILRMYNTIAVDQYVQNVLKQLNAHNIPQRIERLEEYIRSNGFDVKAISNLENLDHHITDIRLQSEKKLLREPTRYLHTAITKTQVHKIRMLEKLKHLHNRRKPCESTIEKLLEYEYFTGITPDTLQDTITAERQTLKQMQEDNDIHRKEHLDAIQERMAIEKNKPIETIIKEMKNREQQKKSWDKIKYVTKKRNRNGISRLGIPQGFENSSTQEIWDYLQTPGVQPKWRYITDEEEIESRLVEWQILHYSQAKETPLTTKEWDRKLNPAVLTDNAVNEILKNGLEGDHIHMSTKAIFNEISDNLLPPMPNEKCQVTGTKLRTFYSKAKESTSASPSGLHLGHWKAAATDEELSDILASIMNIALQHSYPLKRWRKVIGILLEKNPGKPTIHKYRTIHLVESDLNFIMRNIWGRELMKWSETYGGFNSNQYGGRKGYQAQSAALNKTLTCDIIRYYGEPSSLIDNDAQACYDRIIPNMVAYALLRMGMPKTLVRFQLSWLYQAQYKLKLQQGLSKPYQSNEQNHLFGTGQGTGWSPPSWGALSDLITRVADKHIPGLKFVHPNRSCSDRVIDAFVDDVNSGLTTPGLQAFQSYSNSLVKKCLNIYDQTKENLQFYSQLLFTTGGRLALHKCAIYILITKWVQGVRKFEPTHITHPDVPIQQGHEQEYQQVSLEDPVVARRMLGVYTAPDGNSKCQHSILRTKSEQWSKRVESQYLNSYDTIMAYSQGIMKSLDFPTGPSLLTHKQCQHIQAPALHTCLRKNGIVSTISRSVVHGPHRYGGLNFQCLGTENGIQKIELLLGHIRKDDETGRLLKVALGCLQQEVGISYPVLEAPFQVYQSLVTKSWLRIVWEFLNSVQGSIMCVNIWTPKPTFENDKNIMEIVMTWDLPERQYYNINICRLYKKCYYVGDLLDPSGVKLRPNILSLQVQGYHSDKFPTVSLPISFEPLWQFTVRKLVTQIDIGKSMGRLISSRSYQWKLDNSEQYLIKYEDGIQKSIHVKEGEGYTLNPSSLQVPLMISGAATVKTKYNKLIVISKRHLRNPTVPKSKFWPAVAAMTCPTSKDVMNYINSLSTAHKRNIGDLHNSNDIHKIAQHMKNNNVIGVGDASVQNKRAGHSYILESKDESVSLIGSAPTDGDPEDISSNRAEGCTVLAMMVLSTAIAKIFQIRDVEMTIYCDNKEAIRYELMRNKTYKKYTQRDIDIKMEVQYVRSTSPITFTLAHVAGHADDDEKFSYDKANQQTRRNIDMDKRVDMFLRNPPSNLSPTSSPLFFKSQKIGLKLANNLIVGDIRKQVNLHYHGHVLESKIRKLLKIPVSNLNKIDWEAIEVAQSKQNYRDQIKCMKVMHGYLPTATIIHTREQKSSNLCLRCNKSPETFSHIFQCQSRSCKAAHRESVTKLEKSLRKIKTHPLLIQAIIHILNSFQSSKKPTTNKNQMGDLGKIRIVNQVMKQQIDLGQTSLHRGFISRNWMVAQRVCTDACDMMKRDLGWLKHLVRTLWQYSVNMWQQRCKHIHTKDPTQPNTLTHDEIVHNIREILKTPRIQLSLVEKRLHLNITKMLNSAHTITLGKWLKLLSDERKNTQRKHAEKRRKVTKLQEITQFFNIVRRIR